MILRPVSVYGPRQYPGWLISRFIALALADAPLPIISRNCWPISGEHRRTSANICSIIGGMKLSEWALGEGIHYTTAWRWWRSGKLPVPAQQTSTGTILVDVQPSRAGRLVFYARVSSHQQRVELDRQVARVTQWATRQGLVVDEVVGEVGSGVNGKRPRLRRLLAEPQVTTIVVEHRDRLARFGVEHLEVALSAQGRKLVVVDPGETDDDLVRDMVGVLTSFCARLYGRRGARNRAMRALTCAKQLASSDRTGSKDG